MSTPRLTPPQISLSRTAFISLPPVTRLPNLPITNQLLRPARYVRGYVHALCLCVASARELVCPHAENFSRRSTAAACRGSKVAASSLAFGKGFGMREGSIFAATDAGGALGENMPMIRVAN